MAGGSTGFFGLKTAQNVGIRVPTTHQSAIPGTVPRWYWPVSMQRPHSAFSLVLLRASAAASLESPRHPLCKLGHATVAFSLANRRGGAFGYIDRRCIVICPRPAVAVGGRCVVKAWTGPFGGLTGRGVSNGRAGPVPRATM